MAAMLMKNALQLSVRARPVVSGVRTLSILSSSSSSFSVMAPHPAVLMASPHMNAMIQNSLIFETNISRNVQIDDFLPQIHELECPTETLNEPLQAIKRTYQPSVLRRKRKHGFRTRRVSISGRKVLKRRFNKGRWRMSL